MRRAVSLLLALAAFTAACGDSTNTVPSPPTVAPSSIIDTFTGTVQLQSSNAHNFVVAVTGRLAITLTSVGPNSSAALGLGLGVPASVGCSLSLGAGTTVTARASTDPQITGTVLAGTFCVSVYDAGGLTEATDYTISVSHS